MALDAGTITVDASSGAHSGSGLALELFDGWLAKPGLAAALSGVSGTALAAAKTQLAEMCSAFAVAVVTHFTDNAVTAVQIQTTDSGLQRMSNPLTASANTQGPSVQKTLTGGLS